MPTCETIRWYGIFFPVRVEKVDTHYRLGTEECIPFAKYKWAATLAFIELLKRDKNCQQSSIEVCSNAMLNLFIFSYFQKLGFASFPTPLCSNEPSLLFFILFVFFYFSIRLLNLNSYFLVFF